MEAQKIDLCKKDFGFRELTLRSLFNKNKIKS